MTVRNGTATGKPAPSYLELRDGLSRRDRSLRDKVVSLEEAASFVRDDDTGFLLIDDQISCGCSRSHCQCGDPRKQ